jgi:NAD-dependent deacetylase
VITQNIDGLHQLAGSRNVLELHGTALEVGCLECGERYDSAEMLDKFQATQAVPRCEKCGGLTKHATISFGQALSPEVMRAAMRWSHEADLFFAIGSSLVVTPAADLPVLAKESGARLVIVNREPTPLDSLADVVLRSAIGDCMESIDAILTATSGASLEQEAS